MMNPSRKNKATHNTHPRSAKLMPRRAARSRNKTFEIISDRTELPKDSCVEVRLSAYKTDDLVVFAIGDRVGIGRWMPDIAGFDWILQPGRLIAITDNKPFRIIGVVAKVEEPSTRTAGNRSPLPLVA